MASVSISVADPTLNWARSRVDAGQYASVSDYVTDLIERDRRREAAQAELEALLTEGEESGVSDRTVLDIWAEVEAEFRTHAGE